MSIMSQPFAACTAIILVIAMSAPVMAKPSDIKNEVARQFLLASPGKEGFIALEKYFPRDAQKFVRTLARTTKNTSAKTIARRISRTSTQIRKKNARHMRSAPVTNLLQMAKFYRDALIYFKRDVTACNSFYVGGLSALTPSAKVRFNDSKIGKRSVVGLKTLAAGRDTPVRRGKPKRQDYDNFTRAMIDAGMTEQDFASITNSDVADPTLCKSAIKLMTVLHDANTDGIHRIRADIFHSVMAE